MLKILHTADWHLGKKLEDISRHNEQEQILNDIVSIVNKDKYDLIIIAGDIYDSVNPPAISEQLFYNTLKKLIGEDRLIVIVSGNHDNALRLSAAQNLLLSDNVLFFEAPNKTYDLIKTPNLQINQSYPGGVVVKFNKKKIAINTLSYPTETNLNIDFEKTDNYSKYITDLLKTQNNTSTNYDYLINISHLFVGQSETQLGGSLAVNIHDFPKVDYTALGHIHKSQVYKDYNVAYCGSILEYRVSEINNDKCVLDVEINNGVTSINKLRLKNYHPIAKVDVTSLNSALTYLKENKDIYVYLTITTSVPLTLQEKKNLYSFSNLVTLTLNNSTNVKHVTDQNNMEVSDILRKAYIEQNGIEMSDEVYDLYVQILTEVNNETT